MTAPFFSGALGDDKKAEALGGGANNVPQATVKVRRASRVAPGISRLLLDLAL
jgi:hypothetical protein